MTVKIAPTCVNVFVKTATVCVNVTVKTEPIYVSLCVKNAPVCVNVSVKTATVCVNVSVNTVPVCVNILLVKGKKMNIDFLQETHYNNETESKVQSDWGDKCIFSNKNSQSTGVMILFNSNFYYEIEDYIKDNDGRFLICILKVNNVSKLLWFEL